MINESKHKKLNIFCDGGARGNPGPAAIGFVVFDEKGKKIHNQANFIGPTTNNIAEYKAIIAALSWLKNNLNNLQINEVNLYVDSKLVASQLNGEYKIKDVDLKILIQQIHKLEDELGFLIDSNYSTTINFASKKLCYTYIPREKNIVADSLVNQALNSKGFYKRF